MKRMVPALIILLLVIMSLGSSPARPALAVATATRFALECDVLRVTGTSDQTYATIQVYSVTFGNSYFTTVPVSNGLFTASVSFPPQPLGTVLRVQAWGTLNPFTNIYDPGYWDGQAYFEANPACAPSQFGEPPIPSGFVQRMITCDVAVYESPGGSAVPGALLKAGQVWNVNPTPVKDASGQNWTEIFVAGAINGFIPTQCIGATSGTTPGTTVISGSPGTGSGSRAARPSVPAPSVVGRNVYVVQPGDNFFRIALRYGLTVRQLQALNPTVTDPTRIFVGQRLIVP